MSGIVKNKKAAVSNDHTLSLDERFYHSLYRIRRVEEEIIRIYPSDTIKSPVHLSIGQEEVSVGVCQALQPEDVVFGTYRGHAMYLAKGGDLKGMFAELYGKAGGCAKGKGGSMHLIDARAGVMGTSAIVATTIPLAVGYAYSIQYKKSKAVSAVFFGDGAVDEGDFHESLNFAALKKLPVLFVCENNSYAIHSHHLKRHHSDNICERAVTYGMPAERIDEQNVFAIYEATQKYTAAMRKGSGPAFIECCTCRWKEHVGPGDDFHLGYRNEQEVLICKEKDQIKTLAKSIGAERRQLIERAVEDEIQEAIEFAENSPFPQKEELLTDIFKE